MVSDGNDDPAWTACVRTGVRTCVRRVFSSVRTACTEQLQKNVAAATGIYTTDGGWTRADSSVYNNNWTNWTYAQDELDSLISIEQLVSEYRSSPYDPEDDDIMSEIFTFTIAVPTFTTAVAVHASLSTFLGTAAAATEFLLGPNSRGRLIDTNPVITIVGPRGEAPPPPSSPPSPSSPPPPRDDGDDGLSAGASAAHGMSNLA